LDSWEEGEEFTLRVDGDVVYRKSFNKDDGWGQTICAAGGAYDHIEYAEVRIRHTNPDIQI
jgi:hypothetical protein